MTDVVSTCADATRKKWLRAIRALAAMGADGHPEWKLPCRQIHDLHLLPNGHLLYQDGWTRIVELDTERKPVWEYDAKGTFIWKFDVPLDGPRKNGRRRLVIRSIRPSAWRAATRWL